MMPASLFAAVRPLQARSSPLERSSCARKSQDKTMKRMTDGMRRSLMSSLSMNQSRKRRRCQISRNARTQRSPLTWATFLVIPPSMSTSPSRQGHPPANGAAASHHKRKRTLTDSVMTDHKACRVPRSQPRATEIRLGSSKESAAIK